MSEKITERLNKAEAAVDKKAVFGEDIDLSRYKSQPPDKPTQVKASEIPSEDKLKILSTGVTLDDVSQRSGTFVQIDNMPLHSSVQQAGIEVMPISEALVQHDWLKDYFWKAVAVDADKYTAHVELNGADGYFMRALPGAKTVFPIQACLYLSKAHLIQDVHNIIIAEEGSELHIITGCSTSGKEPGLHIGVSEFYIKKGARVTFTMIHSWSAETGVRPRTGAIIEQDGVFLSNYVLMRPVQSIQLYPSARCVGENSTVRFNSVMVATPGSRIDAGSRAYLNARGARTEMVARAITTGGEIVSRGYIEGNEPGVKGHLECRGLIMGNGGFIHAIPELKGTREGIDLSHEAAVGKIAEEEVEYLMARGLTRDEATAAIIRGFLKVDIEGLPPMLNEEMRKAVQASEKEVF
jgi:Fe-S cluster assembly scaffold protein SufB